MSIKFVLLNIAALAAFASCTTEKSGGFSPSKKTTAESQKQGSDTPPPEAPPFNSVLKGPTVPPLPAANPDLSVAANGGKKPWDGVSITNNRLWKIEDVE